MFDKLSGIPELLIENCVNGRYELVIDGMLGYFRHQTDNSGVLYLSLPNNGNDIAQVELWQYCFSSGKLNFDFSMIFNFQHWWLVQKIVLENSENIQTHVYTQVTLANYFSSVLENNIKLEKNTGP
ncbi:hypothetical protein [Providencia sp. Me31A]|uniref:hypothetical protein n=1 Tax=Providencia sp. Me31A TaxID=3392637 RepID=UPI003D2BC3ED